MQCVEGFWLCHKRLSKGRFRFWPTGTAAARALEVHQVQLLLSGGDAEARANVPEPWLRLPRPA